MNETLPSPKTAAEYRAVVDDLLRQIEVLLIQHEDHKQQLRRSGIRLNNGKNTKSQAAKKLA